MDDGAWLKTPDVGYHNHLYRILGGPKDFFRKDIPDYPAFVHDHGGWFGYGIVAEA
jgi:hypothetical protein